MATACTRRPNAFPLLPAIATSLAILSAAPDAVAADSFVDRFDEGDAACWLGFTIRTDVVVESEGGHDGGWLRSIAEPGHFNAGIATSKPEVRGDWRTAEVTTLQLDVRLVAGTVTGGGFRLREGGDVNGWVFPVSGDVISETGSTINAPLDPTWTDEEAAAAGWISEGPGVPGWQATLGSHYQLGFVANGSDGLQMGYDTITLGFEGPTCPSDTDEDAMVGLSDLLMVLAAWGDCQCCPADVNRDRQVDFEDLVTVLATWGTCRE
jgi:hypothetical protein